MPPDAVMLHQSGVAGVFVFIAGAMGIVMVAIGLVESRTKGI